MFDIGKPETVAQWVEQTTHYQKFKASNRRHHEEKIEKND
jgi:hypothetical protein